MTGRWRTSAAVSAPGVKENQQGTQPHTETAPLQEALGVATQLHRGGGGGGGGGGGPMLSAQ